MRRFLLVTALITSSCALAADPMYRIVDKYGNVTYTDTPPAKQLEGQSSAIEQKPVNVLESPPDTDFQADFDRNRAATRQARESAWEAYDQALAAAEAKLKQAQAAQKEGEVVGDGDMIGTHRRNGASVMRLSEEYLARQEALKRAVAEAEAELQALRKNKPMLRRN